MVVWSDRQKKAYHRVLAGMRRHRFEVARFMTLTSYYDMNQDMLKSFNILSKRLYHVTPMTFVNMGYLSREVACRIYGEDNLEKSWEFNYMKILTKEGVSGVLHILYFGIFIPRKWLSDQWLDITGSAYIVDIRYTYKRRDGNFNDLASYCIEQYTAGQDMFVSYFCSRNWIFPGAWKCYDALRRKYRDFTRWIHKDINGYLVGFYPVMKDKLIPAWYACIERGGLLPEPKQESLHYGFSSFMASVRLYNENPGAFGIV